MGPEIEACQANGKIVTLALGGEIASTGFTSDAQAEGFADQIWNSFLGGSHPNAPRPFGNAVLDG
jgi:chitinase